MRSLNHLRPFRNALIGLKRRYLVSIKGARIAPSVSLSLSSQWVVGGPGGITVGEETLIAFKALLLAVDDRGETEPITIGRHCFIGGGSLIGPGVTVGDGSIVGAGAVVLEDVPPRSIVVGNPARIMASDIEVGPYGRLPEADANTARLWRVGE